MEGTNGETGMRIETPSVENPQSEVNRPIAKQEAPSPSESLVFTHVADWVIYALSFSMRPTYQFRLALGSFLESSSNFVKHLEGSLGLYIAIRSK
jgi:hypothetical protein